MTPILHVSRPSPAIVLLELDAPPANGLGMALRGRLAEALTAINADLAVRAVVLTGRGEAFCAGDDLREAATRGDGQLDAVLGFNVLMDQVEACRVPIIAAINGWCLGGGLELALSCDIRVASSRASFAASGVNIGLMASVGRLPRLIGEGRAKAHLLTGATFDSARALADGIVASAHDPAELMTAALDLAERIASRAPLSVEATKRAVAGRGPGVTAELTALVASADHVEAVSAFQAKRPARFERK